MRADPAVTAAWAPHQGGNTVSRRLSQAPRALGTGVATKGRRGVRLSRVGLEPDPARTIQRARKRETNPIQAGARGGERAQGRQTVPAQIQPGRIAESRGGRDAARFRQGLSRLVSRAIQLSPLEEEEEGSPAAMRKFQDSVKALEADIEHANALASEFLRDYDGSFIQMRMAYSAVAHFLVQWTDCKLAGALGLLKVMLYKVYADGSSALPDWEREASIREFYGVIFPSLLQLPSGITELDDRKQRRLCLKKFRSRDEELSEVDTERELECGICLEVNRKVVLPDCAHTLCMRCFEDWNAKSKSCPFCRACLEEVKPGRLWVYTDDSDVVDMDTLTRENIRRLFMYINKLPLVVLHVVDLDIYQYRIK
ncbi:zinc finger CCCH domain-containing protein 69-like [Panicum miliaceum]|uniref:Zinc finger CCCH domain-containing protein 69-like n=1 Tax=Panicum miliaceum TaxID=4540 RepID=A0A3L6TE49_PANMI|nr:zinc finger CCCH domain-containing protein 69-like [Panicum miliaceum]